MPTKRIAWIDLARGYGMLFIFFGHVIEQLYHVGAAGSLPPFKLANSFDIPFFFLLSGLVSRNTTSGFLGPLRRKAIARLAPFLFFNLLILPFYAPPFPDCLHACGDFLYSVSAELLQGRAVFNIPTWFLVCLFVAEIYHRLSAALTTSKAALAASAILFLTVGLAAGAHQRALVEATGLPINVWFLHEALVACGLYQLGALAARYGLPGPAPDRRLVILIGLASLILLLVTFDLNHGPFPLRTPVVTLMLSSHGQPLLFVVTAVSGSVALLCLALLTPAPSVATSWLQKTGRLSVSMLGLNGLLYIFVNPPLAALTHRYLPDTAPWVIFAACAATLVTLLACLPVAAQLDRLVPRLVGHPGRKGKLL